MALNLVNMDYALQIKFNLGEDEDGRMITRSRTINRIKHETSDEDLYEMALALASLQKYDVAEITRNAPVAYEEI